MVYKEEHEYWKKYKYRKMPWTTIKRRLMKGRSIQEACKIANKTRKKCLINSNGRTCSICGEYKLRHHFPRDNTSKNLHTSNCKECRNKLKKQYRSTEKGIDTEKRLTDKRLKSDLGRQQILAYTLYKKNNKNNIRIFKEIGENITKKKSTQMIKDYIKRIGKEDEFYLLFK